MSCDRITRLASSGGRPPAETSTAAEVSSQDVSMPSTTSAMTLRRRARDAVAENLDGIGHRPRADAAGRDDREPHDGAVRREAAVDDDLETVARETRDLRFGSAHGHRDPRGAQLESGERPGAALDGNPTERALEDGDHGAAD